MKRILILLLVVFSCFKLSFSQSNENIWKMPKDTSKFGKVIVKDQIVTFTDSTITGSNILYRCYKNFTATQSVRDVINSGVYKIVGGSTVDSSIYSTIYKTKKLITDSLGRFWDSTKTKVYIASQRVVTDSAYIKKQISDSLKLTFKITDTNTIRNPITLSYFNANNGSSVDSSVYSTIYNTKRLIKDSLLNTFKVADSNTNRNPITLSYFNLHKFDSAYTWGQLNLKRPFTIHETYDSLLLKPNLNIYRPFSIHETYDSLLNKPNLSLKLDTSDYTTSTIKSKLGITTLSGSNTGDSVGHGILTYQTSLKQNRGDTNTITNPITLSYFNTYNNKTDSVYIKKIAHDSISVVSIQRATDAGKTTTNIISSSVSISQINITGGYSLINKNYGDSSYLKLIDSTGIYHSNRNALNLVSGTNTGDTVGHGIINYNIGLKVPTSTTITINGTTQDLSTNRSWTINPIVQKYWNGVDSTAFSTTRKYFMGISDGFVIDTIYAVMERNSGSPDVTFKINYGTDFSQVGTAIVTAGNQVTSYTTATKISTFNNATIPAGNIIWITVPTQAALPKALFITVSGHKN